MLASWFFTRRNPASKARDPLQTELLTNDNFDIAESLVRESIQNSLDARFNSGAPVQIRIHLGRHSQNAELSSHFRGFEEHLRASTRAGHVNPDALSGDCHYVVIEDFNTTGLTGDISAAYSTPDIPNNWYHFVRAEGISGKSQGNLGRWGVGKYVFPKSSDINAFFALTRRSGEPDTKLIGQAVLENHELAGVSYEPDGWFAETDSRGFQLPISDTSVTEEFSRFWNVARTSEPGLSVVVPFISPKFTKDQFVLAVTKAYYAAILAGDLSVVVSDQDSKAVHIHHGNVTVIASVLANSPQNLELSKQIELFAALQGIPSANRFSISPLRKSEEWNKDVMDLSAGAKIRQKLDNGEIVEITCTQGVTRQGERESTDTHYRVIFRREDRVHAAAQYIRTGVLVSDAHIKKLTGMLSFCIVEDPLLVEMLGDAENPAHTNWTPNDRVKKNFKYAATAITNIKQAPHRLRKMIMDAQEDEDRVFFSDIFNIPDPASGGTAANGKRGSRGKASAPSPTERSGNNTNAQKPVGNLLSVTHALEAGTVLVAASENGKDKLRRVTLAFAYDTLRGDPFEQWSEYDFKTADLPLEIRGATVESISNNQLILSVTESQIFTMNIRGFDPKRNLKVRAQGSTVPWK